MHDQILAHLSPAETLLATATMTRPNNAKHAGFIAGGVLGSMIADSIQSSRMKGTLADRLGHPAKMYGVITTHRVVFFADHKIKINTIGAPIVGYGREHLAAATPSIRKVTDSEIRFDFTDGSTAKIAWRKRKEVPAWVAAIEHLMANAPVSAPQGYVSYVLPPGV